MFRYNVIPILADILSESVKEKVTRIILATFRVSAQYKQRKTYHLVACCSGYKDAA